MSSRLFELNVPVDMYIEELGWYYPEFVTLFDNTHGISTHCHCSLLLLFQHLSIVLSNQNEAGDKGEGYDNVRKALQRLNT